MLASVFGELDTRIHGAIGLPSRSSYQRLSADLIDLELGGDLDLYLTGADGQDVGLPTGCFNPPFGRVPNQLWKNNLIP